MIKGIIVWICSALISSLAQVLLKKSANRQYKSLLREYVNVPVVTAYAMYALSLVLTSVVAFSILADHGVPYSSFSSAIESIRYIATPVFGVLLLGELIGKRRILGIAVIIIGILVFIS